MKSFALVGWVVLVASLAIPVSANNWTAAGSDNRWDNPDNWSLAVVPLGAWQHPEFGWDDPDGPFYPLTLDPSDDGPLFNNDAQLIADNSTVLIDENTHAQAYGVRVGNGGREVTLEITGGILDIGGVPPSGGDRVGWHFDIGRGFNQGDPNSVQRVEMSGGVVNTNGLLIPEQFVDDSLPNPADSAPLHGELEMTGGTINARWMNLGQLKGNGSAVLSGDAVINLSPNVASNRNNGGHLEFNRNWFVDGQPVPSSGIVSFDIRDNASVNVFGTRNEFTQTPDQAEVDRYQQYIDDGLLTANGGSENPVLTLQSCPDDGSLDEFCLNPERMMISITAPASALVCDFDENGACNIDDLDALVAEAVAGTNDPTYDLTGDGNVDREDIRDPDNGWLRLAGEENIGPGRSYLEGDIGLDGIVDGLDFIDWNTNKFTATGLWSLGDLDADGSTDGLDFIVWNNFKFQSADSQAVPEPCCLMLVMAGLAAFQPHRRRKALPKNGSRR